MASLGSSDASAVATWQAQTRGFEPRSRQNIIGGALMEQQTGFSSQATRRDSPVLRLKMLSIHSDSVRMIYSAFVPERVLKSDVINSICTLCFRLSCRGLGCACESSGQTSHYQDGLPEFRHNPKTNHRHCRTRTRGLLSSARSRLTFSFLRFSTRTTSDYRFRTRLNYFLTIRVPDFFTIQMPTLMGLYFLASISAARESATLLSRAIFRVWT